MRVISGSARGRKLTTLEGMDVRPTLDKVKGAMFNMIQFDIPGSRVLDLFGGSGALSVEALSRGAAHACVVDQSKKSIQVIEKNLTDTRLRDKADVFHGSFEQFLNGYRGKPFDFAFLDPPYSRGLIDAAMERIIYCQVMAPCGIILCESDRDDVLAQQYGAFVLQKRCVYGKTALSIYAQPQPDGEE